MMLNRLESEYRQLNMMIMELIKKNINLKWVVVPTLSGIPHPRRLTETDEMSTGLSLSLIKSAETCSRLIYLSIKAKASIIQKHTVC